MPYVTGEELAAEIQSNVVSTVAFQGRYDDVVEAVSDAIDNYCFRTFTVASSTATTRTFKPTRCLTEVDELDDIASTSGLAVAVDSSDNGTFTALDADDWYAETDNRTGMVTAIRSTGLFPTTSLRRRTVQVTAKWGWPATPDPVKRAAMIWAIRLVNRSETPTGVMGFAEFGGVRLTTVDPDVKSLLAPYRLRARLLR